MRRHAELDEQTIDSVALLDGAFLHAFRDAVRLPDGTPSSREYIIHPGAVMVVPWLENASGQAQLVLERQYRYPLKRVMIEFPAGKLEPGETSLHCAQRELQEETGYRAAQWLRVGQLHPAIAYSTEFIDIWFAKDLTPGAQRLDVGEFLEVFSASPQDLLTWCQSGLVTDSKTLTGALWVQNVLCGQWLLDWTQACAG